MVPYLILGLIFATAMLGLQTLQVLQVARAVA